jgi:uncharacterized protein YciI
MRRLFMLLVLLAAPAFAQPMPVRQFLLRLEPVRKDFSLQNLTADERRIVAEHLAYLQSLEAAGKLAMAGQVFDSTRGYWGIMILNTPDPAAAAAILGDDPAVKQKMLQGEAIPFRTVVPRPQPPALKN